MNPISGTPVGVEYIEAVAQVLAAIAWPLLVVAVVLSFRKPLRNALQALVEFRFGSTTVKFDRAGGDVARAVVSPSQKPAPSLLQR